MVNLEKAKKEICRVFAEFLEKWANVSFSPDEITVTATDNPLIHELSAKRGNGWPRAEGRVKIIGKNIGRFELLSTWISQYLPSPKKEQIEEDIRCAQLLV